MLTKHIHVHLLLIYLFSLHVCDRWEFSSSSRDIEFEVIFVHQEGIITVVPLNTVKHGNTRSRGSYTPPAHTSGVLKLTWINKASWYTSKIIKYRTGVHDIITKEGLSVPASTQVTPTHTVRGER